MRRKLVIFPALLFIALLLSLYSYSQTPLIDSIISETRIRATIEFLASDSLKGRITGSNEAKIAADYIQAEFKHAGLQPLDSTGYLRAFNAGKKYGIGYNVVGMIPGGGASSEVVIFSAHYDHIGTATTNPYIRISRKRLKKMADTIFNGANDNASGTAALVSLAHYFGTLRQNSRTLIFIAFSGEELGLLGSKNAMAQNTDPSLVACLVNLEMLGRGSKPFVTGADYGNLQYLLNTELSRIDEEKYGKDYFTRDYFPDQRLFFRSDNYPFAQFRIPAHSIMVTTSADKYYHKVDDEPSTLNFELIQNVTRAIALGVMPIVTGKSSPYRIDIPDDR
jgi:hypothetical protein